jgi:hypothetical protein
VVGELEVDAAAQVVDVGVEDVGLRDLVAGTVVDGAATEEHGEASPVSVALMAAKVNSRPSGAASECACGNAANWPVLKVASPVGETVWVPSIVDPSANKTDPVGTPLLEESLTVKVTVCP